MERILGESPLFEGCTTEQLREIAARCERVVFAAGTVVFEANSPANHLYVVVKGSVELRTSPVYYREPMPIAIDRAGPHDVFGWSAGLGRPSFVLEAVAVQDSEVLRLSREGWRSLCEDTQLGRVLMENVAHVVARRFERTQGMVIELLQQHFKSRETRDPD